MAADTTVARTELPGKVQAVNIANLLGINPSEVREFILKEEGDAVLAGETMAENRPFIKWFKTRVASPVTGTVETVSQVTGQVLLREPPRPLELKAFIDGRVVETIEGEGAVVEAEAAFLQGIFGLGGETNGVLDVVVESAEQPLTSDRLNETHRGKVVVGGSFAGRQTFARARELGVRGIVVGGSDDQDLRDLLGYDLGVAITGTEQIGFTLVLTEGFGAIAMAGRTFGLLNAMEGRKASISGATQIRAGVIRPEIIVPYAELSLPSGSSTLPAAGRGETEAGPSASAMREGDLVRAIRAPHFGRIGTVTGLPSDLVQIPTESNARVLEVQFSDGERAIIPRANVEIIES